MILSYWKTLSVPKFHYLIPPKNRVVMCNPKSSDRKYPPLTQLALLANPSAFGAKHVEKIHTKEVEIKGNFWSRFLEGDATNPFSMKERFFSETGGGVQ